jgi:hypothetical protein
MSLSIFVPFPYAIFAGPEDTVAMPKFSPKKFAGLFSATFKQNFMFTAFNILQPKNIFWGLFLFFRPKIQASGNSRQKKSVSKVSKFSPVWYVRKNILVPKSPFFVSFLMTVVT